MKILNLKVLYGSTESRPFKVWAIELCPQDIGRAHGEWKSMGVLFSLQLKTLAEMLFTNQPIGPIPLF